LDVSKNWGLVSLNFVKNEITSIDVTKNSKLTELNCSQTQLLNLNISKNPLLKVLTVEGCVNLKNICVADIATVSSQKAFKKDQHVAWVNKCK
jgi:hypothetical protein